MRVRRGEEGGAPGERQARPPRPFSADERRGRIFVDPGPADRYAASGWEMADEASFEAALADIAAAGTVEPSLR